MEWIKSLDLQNIVAILGVAGTITLLDLRLLGLRLSRTIKMEDNYGIYIRRNLC